MEKNHKYQAAGVILQLSDLLIKKKIVRNTRDERALVSAMKTMAHQLAGESITEKKGTRVTPADFAKQTLSRLMQFSHQNQLNLETQRKDNYFKSLSMLQDRPRINRKSREMVLLI